MPLRAGHGDVHQGQVQLVGMLGHRTIKLFDVHRDHRFDGGIKFGELDLDPFDDQAVVVCDEHFHCGTFMHQFPCA